MNARELLFELYGRLPPLASEAVEGLDASTLRTQVRDGTNPIGWLVWHATRVQDHHLAELRGTPQVWVSGDWADGFGLAAEPDNTGYGHDAAQVAAVAPTGPDALLDYLGAVQEGTVAFLATLDEDALDRIIDRRWDPPVTMGVRLVSVADDSLQHLGQANYLRGILER